MKLDNITRQVVLDAVDKIEREGIKPEPSRKFDVIINGKAYPPKEVMRYANLVANGVMDWNYSGGKPTNKFLTALDFEVVQKGNGQTSDDHNMKIPLTGNVWKLGCRWGDGKPNFYDLIEDHSIVICTEDKRYAPGDLVMVADGYDILALAKVLENPKYVTENPDLETGFHKYEIDYDPWVEYATAEWYELEEDEIFTYPERKGRCRVNNPYKSKAITIWNDRSINYWLFQSKLTVFDLVTSVRNNTLHDWTVNAHKDKIKKGDKVILWVSGNKSGCYALGRVTSNPALSSALPDDNWKTEPITSLKAGIEITHNLTEKPLLWQNIKDVENLKDLNVGNPGTNFSATRKQYNSLLKLIEASGPIMNHQLDLFINTIIYGPPGTGKTYKLNEYKNSYFTDSSITKTTEEVLQEKVKPYFLWKLMAAVLGTSDKSLSVEEITKHPIVKAKANHAIKTKQQSIAWTDLQSYADDESTQLESKYRRAIKLFHKDDESKWSITDNKKEELSDIIGNELLEMAKNPFMQVVENTTAKRRYNFITFHQKYSYEDFIEGIKPLLRDTEDVVDQAGELQFELKKGIFYNSCLDALKLVGYESFAECYNDTIENRNEKFKTALNNPSKHFALFIDEINRANISAVFGELITLLEDDKRIGADNEMWVELPYSNEKFCVPSNLYVIGTMNTADRSIALLDIALRRRFEFKALYPDYIENAWWSQFLQMLNQAIYNWKKNPDFFIGHAFFINKDETDKVKILNTKIIPLLYEYCQNNADTVKRILLEAGVAVKQTGIKENFQIIAE